MRHTIPFVIPLFFATLSAPAPAPESDEAQFRQNADAIQAEARNLAEQGFKDEALKLNALAQEIKARADRPAISREPIGAESELAELRARKSETLDKLQKTMRSVRNPNDPALQVLKHRVVEIDRKIEALEIGEAAPQRIMHLRVAAEHLMKAGMLDLTRQLLEKAASEESVMIEAQQRAAAREHDARKPDEPQKNGEVEELRNELKKVRAELDELRKQIKPN